MRRLSLGLLALVCLGFLTASCVAPRSIVIGQTAELLPGGSTEAEVTPGVLYERDTSNNKATVAGRSMPLSTSTGTVFSAPQFEGNLAYGIDDWVGLNFHASPAGLQPGVKFGIVRDRHFKLALLPQVDLGYLHTSNLAAGATTSGSGSLFTFLAGG